MSSRASDSFSKLKYSPCKVLRAQNLSEMGNKESRELGTEIVNCAEKGVGLESLLEDPKVTNCNVSSRNKVADYQILSQWKLAYKRSPPALRRSIQEFTSTPSSFPNQSLKPKEDCLAKLRRVQESDIGISKELRPQFELWKHPGRFFDHNTLVVAVEDTVSQVYLQLRHIVSRSVDDPIRARIYAVALYDLRLEVDKRESLQLRPEVREKIEQVIFDSPLVKDSPEDVSKWTKIFLKFGERMKAIAEGNGGLGALIVIPSSLLTLRQ
jgi:hypothetical protein